MPYLETWSEFLEQAQQLFVASPGRTRLVTKFRAEQALAHHPGMGMGVGHDASGSGSGAGAGAGAGAGGSGSGGGGKKGGRKGRHHGDGGESHGSLVVKVTDDVKVRTCTCACPSVRRLRAAALGRCRCCWSKCCVVVQQ